MMKRICFDAIVAEESPVVVRTTNPCERISRFDHRLYSLRSMPTELTYNVCGAKKPLRNPVDGSFAVWLSEDNVYLPELIKEAQDLGLTVSGDGSATVKGGDIVNAGVGDILTFGTSSRFDVNWIRRSRYACEKGRRPIYDVAVDWKTILKALKCLAKEKKALENEVYYTGATPLFKDLRAASRKSNCGCISKGRNTISRRYTTVRTIAPKPLVRRCYEAPKPVVRCNAPEIILEDCRGLSGRLHSDFVKIGYDFIPRVKSTCDEVTSSYVVYI